MLGSGCLCILTFRKEKPTQLSPHHIELQVKLYHCIKKFRRELKMMNIELVYYSFLGEVFAMVYIDRHILLRKNVPTMSIETSEIFFSLVYMLTSKI